MAAYGVAERFGVAKEGRQPLWRRCHPSVQRVFVLTHQPAPSFSGSSAE
ncbi:hypothetical protein RRSWK_06209 [Rhodopirellula sp. SWK7]|nr:hypothetical protein RRSWK_06209 [Rhodopirellula sp. SWK7]